MKNKTTLFVLLIVFNYTCFAQTPYIGTSGGQGLGQYGYLNKNAITFATLDRNTYNNINSLAARWYVNGTEKIYNVSGGSGWAGCSNWQCSACNSQNLPTANFNAADFGANWVAGNNAYVSVYAYYCGGGFSNSPGTTGFNERTFTIVDLNTNTPSPSLGTTVSGGGCNSKVVGSFTLDVGSASGLNLTRFFTQNSGTASEATLGNTAFKLYYEPATGSETFNGAESNVPLYGDYGGDPTNNNIFGNAGFSISLSGITRFYLVACNNPVIIGTVDMSIINDGISLSPANNSYGTLRVNSISLGGSIVLPLTLISFNAEQVNGMAKLSWTTASEININSFDLEKSEDGISFEKIGQVKATGMGTTATNYNFTDNQLLNTNYYRIRVVENNGGFSYSKVVVVKNSKQTKVVIAPNPASSLIMIRGSKPGDYLTVTTASGVIKLNRQISTDDQKINVQDWPAGIYYVKISNDNAVVVERFIIAK